MRAKILIINTGGTLGMTQTAAGYVPQSDFLAEQMQKMPEFHHPDMPAYDIKEYSPLLDSACMTPTNWQKIAEDIAQHYQAYSGFIIIHGTDTMAYTAAALSFLLEHLGKPVILTGSQVPLIKAHTDARENLLNALYMASHYVIPEVCIFFYNQLFRGNRCCKMNAYSFAAFASPNYPILASVGVNFDIQQGALLPLPEQPFCLKKLQPVDIAVVRLRPSDSMEYVARALRPTTQALVLETFGIGNGPVDNPQLQQILQRAKAQNTLVINHSQCPFGGVDMEKYQAGKLLQEQGVISAHDMTAEAIIAKLHFLFAEYTDPREIQQQFMTNLRGELSGREG